ncbi:MAG TPA: STAS domain-containing protein [Permianibacter sp.]|nr:STAS domain-containing protein [Permianibacter sp.]
MADSTAVIRLQSKFDFSWFSRFKELYEPLLADSAVREIAVNFADVNYIDSSALGMLMLLKERADAAGKRVRLVQCQGYAKELLTVANFQSKFTME